MLPNQKTAKTHNMAPFKAQLHKWTHHQQKIFSKVLLTPCKWYSFQNRWNTTTHWKYTCKHHNNTKDKTESVPQNTQQSSFHTCECRSRSWTRRGGFLIYIKNNFFVVWNFNIALNKVDFIGAISFSWHSYQWQSRQNGTNQRKSRYL